MEKSWKEMTAAERRQERYRKWLSPAGIQFKSAEAGEKYRKSVTRFIDALEMEKAPDRVPSLINVTFLIPYLYGLSPYEAMYDPDRLIEVNWKYLDDFQPDHGTGPVSIGSGTVLDMVDYKQYRWAGHGLPKTSSYQAVEGEYMLADEYEFLIDDPTDFWLRIWMPRAFGAFEGLKNIDPFTNLWEIVGVSPHMIPFSAPPIQTALKVMADAGNAALPWIQKMAAFGAQSIAAGYTPPFGGVTKAPFDIIADTLRGTRGMMLDMYRQPDMVVKAVERLTPLAIRQGVSGSEASGQPMVFIPLHKGADGFMSDAQFRKFYWPTLKATILGICAQGCMPFLFCEGGFDSRLEYLKELPKASSFWLFDRTDMKKAKETVGLKNCIGGNVPASIMLTGTVESVRKCCKDLIDTVGKGGGYIMGLGTALDEGRADTLHEVIDFTREYGVYR
jgi:uroporphyrinogen-III decarboxylase